MPANLPHGHSTGVYGHDLLVEAREKLLAPRYQLGTESARPVARNFERHLRGAGQHRLLRSTVPPVQPALLPLIAQVLVEFGVQDALRQRLLQLVDETVAAENLLRLPPRAEAGATKVRPDIESERVKAEVNFG